MATGQPPSDFFGPTTGEPGGPNDQPETNVHPIRPEVAIQGKPDPKMIEILESALTSAKAGELESIAIVAIGHDNSASNHVSGLLSMALLGMIEMLKFSLSCTLANSRDN